MRQYDDPREHMERVIQDVKARHVAWMKRDGIKPNPDLEEINFQIALKEAKDSYLRHADEVLEHNTNVHMRQHRRRMNQIKREGAKLRLIMCPPICLVFGFLAWYMRSEIIPAVIYAVMALAFLAMLIGGIFDRPEQARKER